MNAPVVFHSRRREIEERGNRDEILHAPTTDQRLRLEARALERSVDEHRLASPDRVEVVSVSFSAFIIVPIGSKDKFDERIKERQARIADLVNGLVQRATFDDLNSSELLWLKGELQPALSRALQTDEIRDVIITEFSISVG